MVLANSSNKIIVLPADQSSPFDLVAFIVAIPSENPNPAAIIQGRPFEFTLELPSKFSAMCPFCCQGIYICACDIVEKHGFKFISCPECGVGKEIVPLPPPAFVDPFVNPFSSKQLARCELDEVVTPVGSIQNDDSLTVAQKLTRAKS